jgi:hypothetical protein
MNLSEGVAISASSLWAHKLRSVPTLIGGVIGVLFGSRFSPLMRYGLKMPAVLSLFWIATALIMCALIGIVFGVYPGMEGRPPRPRRGPPLRITISACAIGRRHGLRLRIHNGLRQFRKLLERHHCRLPIVLAFQNSHLTARLRLSNLQDSHLRSAGHHQQLL